MRSAVLVSRANSAFGMPPGREFAGAYLTQILQSWRGIEATLRRTAITVVSSPKLHRVSSSAAILALIPAVIAVLSFEFLRPVLRVAALRSHPNGPDRQAVSRGVGSRQAIFLAMVIGSIGFLGYAYWRLFRQLDIGDAALWISLAFSSLNVLRLCLLLADERYGGMWSKDGMPHERRAPPAWT